MPLVRQPVDSLLRRLRQVYMQPPWVLVELCSSSAVARPRTSGVEAGQQSRSSQTQTVLEGKASLSQVVEREFLTLEDGALRAQFFDSVFEIVRPRPSGETAYIVGKGLDDDDALRYASAQIFDDFLGKGGTLRGFHTLGLGSARWILAVTFSRLGRTPSLPHNRLL